MADVAITASSVLASNLAQIDRKHSFGGNANQGDVMFRNSSSVWVRANATNLTLGGNVGDVIGIALSAGANGQPGAVVIRDPSLTVGGTLANGAAYYASPNAGKVAPAADITTGNAAIFLGLARSTTAINFAPISSGIVR